MERNVSEEVSKVLVIEITYSILCDHSMGIVKDNLGALGNAMTLWMITGFCSNSESLWVYDISLSLFSL